MRFFSAFFNGLAILGLFCGIILVTLNSCSRGHAEWYDEETEYPYIDPRYGSAKRQEQIFKREKRMEAKIAAKAEKQARRERRALRAQRGF